MSWRQVGTGTRSDQSNWRKKRFPNKEKRPYERITIAYFNLLLLLLLRSIVISTTYNYNYAMNDGAALRLPAGRPLQGRPPLQQ